MPKVVLATGVEQLDRLLSEELARHRVECAGECYYLEGVLPFCMQKSADTVIISPELPGTARFSDVLLSLRKSEADIRIILLPGPIDLAESLELARSVFWTGIYDFIFSSPSTAGSKVNVEEVVRRLLIPATFAEAEAALADRGATPPPVKSLRRSPGAPAPGTRIAGGGPAPRSPAERSPGGHGERSVSEKFKSFNEPPAVDQVRKQRSETGPADLEVAEACRRTRLIAVYSPTTDAGKTLIAVGLAEALATRNVKTALLDLDLAAGDATRVFRIANASCNHPTVSSWASYAELPPACLRSKAGVYVLPRPCNYTGEADGLAGLIPGLTSQFEVTVADLGVDYRPFHWKCIVEAASERLLVSDCDHKALFRLGAFLYAQGLPWLLVVNLRESRSSISPPTIVKILSSSGLIRGSLIIPHIARVEKMNPGTFKPDSDVAEHLVRKALGLADTVDRRSGSGKPESEKAFTFRFNLNRGNWP